MPSWGEENFEGMGLGEKGEEGRRKEN